MSVLRKCVGSLVDRCEQDYEYQDSITEGGSSLRAEQQEGP